MAIFSNLSKVVFYVPHFMSYFFSIFQKKKKKKERNVWDKIIYILDFLQQTFNSIFSHDG